ncbi:MAG: nuclear transport factor 2 family protein [Ktedonobacterales bacterium]
MTQQSTPVTIARDFLEAWTSHHMDTIGSYLTEDVVFDGPVFHSTGKQAYIQGLDTFARTVTGMKPIALFGDDTQALMMYEVTTAPGGTLTCAELLTFRDGKIATDLLTFDTYPARQAAAAQPPAPSATD